MKKILVPTDFSPVAENALNYAIEIAARFSSEILLYHVYSFHRRVDYDRNFSEDEQPYVKNLENKMKIAKSQATDKADKKGVSIQTIVEENNVLYLFRNKVEKHNVDLVVMGTKGQTGMDRVIFGSVAVTALESATAPVLVVPPEYHFSKIERVALATDLNGVSKIVLSILEEFILKFSSNLTVLSILSEGSERILEKEELKFDGIETQYEEVEMSTGINESINDFVEAHSFDLICMIRRDKGFLESIFKKSITKAQVYQTKIPLLVLTEKP